MAERKRTALVVIDMANRFDFPGGAALARNALAITPAIVALRARFDAARSPVIHANDQFGRWREDFDALSAHCLRAGGIPAAIMRQLQPRPHHHRLAKPAHSAFLHTALAPLLEQLKVGRVVLAGVASDACVLATALDATMRGLPVWIPSDAVAARTAALQRSALHIAHHGLRLATTASTRVAGLFPPQ